MLWINHIAVDGSTPTNIWIAQMELVEFKKKKIKQEDVRWNNSNVKTDLRWINILNKILKELTKLFL